MKSVSIILLLLAGAGTVFAQDKHPHTYACTDGKIHIFSSTPIENVDATSNSAVCVLNTDTKKVFAKIKMTSLHFVKQLMEEHFNENYMESDKFPYGTLEATIQEDIDFTKDGTYDVTLKGTFEVHGVKQDREIKGKITVKNGEPVQATANFDVRLADHKIAIPKAVVMDIAETINVDVVFNLTKYKG